MCRSKTRVLPQKNQYHVSDPPDQENVAFDSLCSLNNENNDGETCGILLDHHVYSSMKKCWEQRRSLQQPVVKINAYANPDDYTALGLSLGAPTKNTTFSAIADTGCQSCLAGMNVVQRLGLTHADLIPVKMRMRAANDNNIGIVGAVILRFTGKSESGQTHETREMV